MSLGLSSLIPELQPFAQSLIDLAGRAGVQPRVTSTLRTHSEQKRLYAAFVRGESHYPVAPPGTSAHEYGYAFDMVCDTLENLHDVGQVWTSWGGIWSPNDEVHFEYPGFVAPASGSGERPTFFDYFSSISSLSSLPSALFELGYIALSQKEAESIARQLHIDPYGRIF